VTLGPVMKIATLRLVGRFRCFLDLGSTSFGCERKMAWFPGSSIVSDLALRLMNRSRWITYVGSAGPSSVPSTAWETGTHAAMPQSHRTRRGGFEEYKRSLNMYQIF
jgi:hypothetical protein